MSHLIKGAIDLHIHLSPDVVKRKCDDFEMAQRARKKGMGGFLIKSHYDCTGTRAKLVNEREPGIKAYGAIVLNNSVGGLSPVSVEVAVLSGTRMVFMPTFDALNKREHFQKWSGDAVTGKGGGFFSNILKQLEENHIQNPAIYILDEHGDLKPEALRILEVVNRHNLALSTGHLGFEEVLKLAEAADKIGFRRLLVSHVGFTSTHLTIEQQKRLCEFNLFFEHSVVNPLYNYISWEEDVEGIRCVGPERCVLSTDLGMLNRMYPDEGFEIYAEKLTQYGFTKEELTLMMKTNPEFLMHQI